MVIHGPFRHYVAGASGGIGGYTLEAIPVDRLIEICKRHGAIKD